jgi:glyoxylase-like metal-dependent hydrolase (beta-lactamase superfamily II)
MEIVKVSRSAYHLCDSATSANFGCVVTPDGVIVIDPGCSAQMASTIHSRIRDITDQPIAYAINTHGHVDHSLGNGHFDVPVIAHQSCYQAMERARAAQERELARHDGARGGKAAELISLPTVSFTEDGYLYVGGVLLELLHTPGRRDGALAVHLPDEKVLFVGDTVHVDAYPVIEQANTFRWMETLVRLRALGATKIIAARGRAATLADIDRQIAHFQTRVSVLDPLRPGDSEAPLERLATGQDRAVDVEVSARGHKGLVNR